MVLPGLAPIVLIREEDLKQGCIVQLHRLWSAQESMYSVCYVVRLGKEPYPPEGNGAFLWKCKLKLQWDTTTYLLGTAERPATSKC